MHEPCTASLALSLASNSKPIPKFVLRLEPGTASLALYIVSKSKPRMFRSYNRTMTLLKRNKHEIMNAAAEELTEPMLDIMQSTMPSWITMILFILFWIIVFAMWFVLLSIWFIIMRHFIYSHILTASSAIDQSNKVIRDTLSSGDMEGSRRIFWISVSKYPL